MSERETRARQEINFELYTNLIQLSQEWLVIWLRITYCLRH